MLDFVYQPLVYAIIYCSNIRGWFLGYDFYRETGF